MPEPLGPRATSVRVVVRCRPPTARESSRRPAPGREAVVVDAGAGRVTVRAESAPARCFAFDRVFDQRASQEQVYRSAVREGVVSTLDGFNATVFCYGQTGSGKTHTMFGDGGGGGGGGIVPRAVADIFDSIRSNAKGAKFLVRASFLQIYNEVISDLIRTERSSLQLREDRQKGVHVEGLSEWVVRSAAEVQGLVQRGTAARATSATAMNDASSRSHAVLSIIVECSQRVDAQGQAEEEKAGGPGGGTRIVSGKLHLVDLAGSERVQDSMARASLVSAEHKQRLREGRQINASLSALGNVITALTRGGQPGHVPYRDSKLTRLLQGSLGGNCSTTLVATISAAESVCAAETLSTLSFASRAKSIINTKTVNEELDEGALLRKYESEVRRLRSALLSSGNFPDNNGALKEIAALEVEKKHTDHARAAVCEELALSEQELAVEQADKRRLQSLITQLASKLLTPGGNEMAADPSGTDVTFPQQVVQLDAEAEAEAEEKVARYRQTLERQRLVMMALTTRLRERDEAILNAQHQVDRYDRLQHRLEECLDTKTSQMMKGTEAGDGGSSSRSSVAASGQSLEPLEASLKKKYSEYRAGVAQRLASQAADLGDLRTQHEHCRQQRQHFRSQADNGGEAHGSPWAGHQAALAACEVGATAAAEAERQSQAEADRLQEQVGMAQQLDCWATECGLLLLLLESKVKIVVDSLISAHARPGGWMAADASGDLLHLQLLVGRGIEALNI